MDEDPDEVMSARFNGVGTCTVLDGRPRRPPPRREFFIGFHVAAPGPSHDDEPAPRQRATKPKP